MLSCSVVSDSATPWTVAHQAPLSMGSPRQEYWSGLTVPTATSVSAISCIDRWILYHCAPWEALYYNIKQKVKKKIMLEFHSNRFLGLSGLVNTHWVLKLETHPRQMKNLGNQAESTEKRGKLKLHHQTFLA